MKLTNKHIRSPLGWKFLVITHDNKILKYYIDGKLFETESYEFYQDGALVPLTVGTYIHDSQVNAFKGTMDEIMIFNKVLNDEKIQEIYENTRPEWIIMSEWKEVLG